MPRPAKKKTRVLAEAERTGVLNAERKFKKKITFEEILKEKLSAMLDRIDPFEAAAILGGTVLIKTFIFQNPLFKAGLEALTGTGGALPYTTSGIFARLLENLFGKPSGELLAGSSPLEGPTGEIILWLAAFAISFYAFRHGFELLEAAGAFFGVAIK